MYGLTRGLMTLVGVAIAGGLIWLAGWFGPRDSMGDYWIAMGLVAAAGLVIAVSQLLGGWTKWGVPTVSPTVLVLGFLPALVAGGWIVIAAQPSTNEAGNRIAQWSSDIGIGGIVADMTPIVGAVAFGLGLVFGLIFDTAGPRRRDDVVDDRDRYVDEDRRMAPARHADGDGRVADEPIAAERARTDDKGRTYDETDTSTAREPAGVGARDEGAPPSEPQPEPEARPRRRSFFRR